MINNVDRAVVESYVAEMQAGPGGLEDLVGLFTDDAVYVEPWTGPIQVHTGKAEIRAFYAAALEQMRGAQLTIDRLDIDGDRLRSEWTCTVPAFNGPMRGFDLITLRDGRIARLETNVTQMAAPPHA